jgi:hypothetical protein
MMKKVEHSTTGSKDASGSPSTKEVIMMPKKFWPISFRGILLREADAKDLLDTRYVRVFHYVRPIS